MNDYDDNYEESYDDSFSGGNKSNNGMNPVIKWVIILTVALVVGVTVYFVTDALINGGNKNQVNVDEDTPMTLNDEMITYLYGNVSYNVKGTRNTIFFEKDSVEANDFSNNDKLFFAFRYITSQDFTAIYEEVEVEKTETEKNPQDDHLSSSTESSSSDTGKEKETETVSRVKEYSISNELIAAAVEDFFGEGVTYNTDSQMKIGVNFTVNGFNAGMLRYDNASDSFLIKFDSKYNEAVENSAVKPYYGQIVSAIRKAGTQHIVIKEKVIFTKSSKRAGATADAEAVYDYSVCADYACNEVLDSKTGVKESDYYNNPIELADYEAQATTITYTFFKDSVNEYHFLSSSKDK